MAEYAHLSIPDPKFIAAAASLPSTPDLGNDVGVIRTYYQAMTDMIAATNKPLLPVESKYRVFDHAVEAGDGWKVPVRCVVPAGGQKSAFPLLFYIHGGGFLNGNLDVEDYFLRRICVEFQVSVVNLDYRLAPEHPSPVGLNDCYAVLKWATTAPEELAVALEEGFILAGISAGSNYAAVLAHRARDDPFFQERNVKFTGHILQLPVVLHPKAYPEKYKSALLSLEQNKDALFLGKNLIYRMYDLLGGDPHDPEVSPLLYPSHAGLPPTYFQICGLDPLRDEGFLYEKLLKEAGVETTVDVYPGVVHGFHYFFLSTSAAVKFNEDFEKQLGKMLKA